MCGIAAIFAYDDRADPVSRMEMEAISRRMISRGPDANGEWYSSNGRVALASRRLAIIDPTPDGTQPMLSRRGTLVIVFNGEIYNHRELRRSLERMGADARTRSDTEVLLQLYEREGERMVERLRGMYALAIWDERTGRLFVARDPYGIKPLYFADDGRTIRIASQVKALIAGGKVSGSIDPAGLAGFFLMGSVPEPITIRDSIRSVEAGTSFHVADRGREPARRHFSIAKVYADAIDKQGLATLAEPGRVLREMVGESLSYHLVSDVPLAVFLSSGIDSTSVAVFAQERTREPIHAFTIGFEERDSVAVNEIALAKRFADAAGIRHDGRIITKSEFQRDLPRIFDQMDQPTIDGVNSWFASKVVHEAGIKVALSGLGGDELFGSYPSFAEVPKLVHMARIPLASKAASLISRHPKAALVGRYGRTWSGAYLLRRGLFLPGELSSVLGEETARAGLERLSIEQRIEETIFPDPGTSFGRVATLESSLYMRNQLLRDTDWASMAHSVEVRTPLVDAALLRQLAPILLVLGPRAKHELGRTLPPSILEQPKRGFSIPLAAWADLAPDGTTTRMRSWARRVHAAALI